MKHTEQWTRLVLVVLGTLSLVSSQDLKTSEDVGDSGIPSGLRGVGGGVVVPEKMNHVVASLSSQIAEASGTAITKLTMEERANVMENLHKSIEDVSDFLANLTFVSPIDVHDSGVEHGHFMFQQLNHALESSKDARQDAIVFVRGSTPVVPRNGSDPKKDKIKSGQYRRRTKESDSSRESSHHSNNAGGRFKAHSFTAGAFKHAKNAFKAIDGTFPGFRGILHHFEGHRAGSSKIKFYGKYVPPRGDRGSGRRLSTEKHDEMCLQLAKCVNSMSRYDMFVYFRSDDIDEASGEVDSNVVLFSDADLLGKYNEAKAQASSVLQDASPNATKCSELLQIFHRTIELEDVPKWEGATVSEVCHAEGTPIYTNLGSAAAASVDVTGFREAAWTNVVRRMHEGNSAWDSMGNPGSLKAVSVTTNGNAMGLDVHGRIYERKLNFNEDEDEDHDWWDPYISALSNSFTTPLQCISAASENSVAERWVGVDVNGEIFKKDFFKSIAVSYTQPVDVAIPIHQVDVGSDGSVWGVQFTNPSNKLFTREGAEWKQLSTCGRSFKSVHVGDKNHVWLIDTNGKMFEYHAVKGCPDSFKNVRGTATWVSVAVDHRGQEKGIFHVGGGHIWVMDKSMDRYGSGPWRRIEFGTWKYVSGDGYGNLYATHENGRISKWGGPNIDEFDWSQPWLSSYNENFDNGDVYDPPAGGKFTVVSAAPSGEVCAIFDKTGGGELLYCGGDRYGRFGGLAKEFVDPPIAQVGSMSLGASKFNFYFANSVGELRRRRPSGMVSFQDNQQNRKFLNASVTDDGYVWAVVKTGSNHGADVGTIAIRKYDGSDNYELVGKTIPLVDLSAISQSEAWAVKSDGSVIRTFDGGNTWIEITMPEHVLMKRIDAETSAVWAVDTGTSQICVVAQYCYRMCLSEYCYLSDKNIYRYNLASPETDGSAWVLENSGEDNIFVDVGVGKISDVVAIKPHNDGLDYGVSHRYLGVDILLGALSESFENAVKTFAEEPLFCARDLFESSWRKAKSVVKYASTGSYTQNVWKDEPFVFGINGTDPGSDITQYLVPVAVDTESSGRDANGQLLSMNDSGFKCETYVEMLADYRGCAAKVVTEFDAKLDKALLKASHDNEAREVFDEHFNGFVDTIGKSCIAEALFDKIETGLALVFGTQPSTGFICGIKDATLAQPPNRTRNEVMPGKLDCVLL